MSTEGNREDRPTESKVPTKVIVFYPRQPVLVLESVDFPYSGQQLTFHKFPSSINSAPATDNLNNSVASNNAKNSKAKPSKANFSFSNNGNGGGPVKPLPDPVDPSLDLSSVGGLDEHVRYLKRAIMYPLKHQGSLKAWGIDPPKGIMFHGPPGTGKTLLAKSLANELSKSLGKKFSFFYQKGGEVFDKYFGESEKKLKQLFYAANHYKPSIIFFDEIDGLCPDRSGFNMAGSGYATVVTALLGLMDSVKRGDVFVIGATNRLDSIDPAVRRPGRFDKQLAFCLPCENGRQHIIGIHTKEWPHDRPTGDLLTNIVKRTNGYTGADLEKVCRDTVVAAMTRSGDIPTYDVRITVQDWATAVQNMTYTSTNVFGSTLFIAEPILPVLHPLVSSMIEDMLSLVKPLIPQNHFVTFPKLPNNRSENGSSVSDLSLSRNSLLVSVIDPSYEPFMDTSIRGLLSHPSLGKMTTYLLSDETLLQNWNRTPLMAEFSRILRQALNSEKPCFLYMPRINVLEYMMNKLKIQNTFYRQLMRLRGTNVILLATSVGQLEGHSDELLDLFIGHRRHYDMQLPGDTERLEFYLQIFEGLIDNEPVSRKKAKKSNPQPDYSEIFEDQLELAVTLTDNDVMDYMLTLYEALTKKKAEYTEGHIDLMELSEDFDAILDQYAKDKLQ